MEYGLRSDATQDPNQGQSVEAEPDRPVLLYIQFGTMPRYLEQMAANRSIGYVKGRYTHQGSRHECAIWNSRLAKGSIRDYNQPLSKFEAKTYATTNGPRAAKLYLRDGRRGILPVDFHFLENYHIRTFENPDADVPFNGTSSWSPIIVVRLQEVYRVMGQISPHDRHGVKKFFGFLAGPGVRLLEYWILIDDKDIQVPDEFHDELPQNNNQNTPRGRQLLHATDSFLSEDVLYKTPSDLVAVDDVDILNDRDRERLRKVAGRLRSWGPPYVVQPRVVRWAVQDERYHEHRWTLFQLVDEIDRQENRSCFGLGTFPYIGFR
ncbi:hypothetical protein F4677DRAFT_461714 [Hypoxylon crocopeplum]|nr:hypothetical protein F4677DRAFT_461714 [Hypoxylon crocopeplum]